MNENDNSISILILTNQYKYENIRARSIYWDGSICGWLVSLTSIYPQWHVHMEDITLVALVDDPPILSLI